MKLSCECGTWDHIHEGFCPLTTGFPTPSDEDEEEIEFFDEPDEPELDEQFEFESAMTSAGWGTEEDYGYYGGDEVD